MKKKRKKKNRFGKDDERERQREKGVRNKSRVQDRRGATSAVVPGHGGMGR
jgi:hypothetical protein